MFSHIEKSPTDVSRSALEAFNNSHEETMIAELAFAKWESAGKPAGDSTRFWDEAVKEVKEIDRGS